MFLDMMAKPPSIDDDPLERSLAEEEKKLRNEETDRQQSQENLAANGKRKRQRGKACRSPAKNGGKGPAVG